MNNCSHIDCDSYVNPVGHNASFPVHGPVNLLKGLRYRGLLGDLPLLQAYRRGVGFLEGSTPQPVGNGPFQLILSRAVPTAVSLGASGIMDSTRPKRFQQHSYSPRKLAAYRGFVASLDGIRRSEFSTSSPTRLSVGSSPRGPYRRREGFGSRASYFPHNREYQNRNVSHLNLLSGGAPKISTEHGEN